MLNSKTVSRRWLEPLILCVHVVELVLSFPTDVESPQSEIGLRSYGQNTDTVQSSLQVRTDALVLF